MAFTTIQGSGANDATTFVGTSGVDFINFAPGANDTGRSNFFLGAQGANDVIQFTGTNKTYNLATLRGGDGNDSFTIAGVDAATTVFNGVFINGNGGNDTINTGSSTIFGSTFQGGQGVDTITVRNLNGSLVNGNKGNDVIAVTAATSSSIFGGQGADVITINTGAVTNSVIHGDNDNDILNISGQFTASTINGNAGDDRINLLSTATFTTTTVFGGAGNDIIITAVSAVISGDDGNDTITSSSTSAAITAFGGAGNDTITGGGGNDLIDGGADNDRIDGGDGNDTILGGAGNDTIAGGAGVDRLTGGAGADLFFQTTGAASTGVTGQAVSFAGGLDIITDFNSLDGDVLSSAGAVQTTIQTAVVQNLVRALFRGTLNGTTFTVADAGNDLLFATTGATSGTMFADNSIALVGGFANFNTAVNYLAAA